MCNCNTKPCYFPMIMLACVSSPSFSYSASKSCSLLQSRALACRVLNILPRNPALGWRLLSFCSKIPLSFGASPHSASTSYPDVERPQILLQDPALAGSVFRFGTPPPPNKRKVTRTEGCIFVCRNYEESGCDPAASLISSNLGGVYLG